MADRQNSPNIRRTLAANAALFVTVAIFAAPALAATSSRIPCSESIEVTLNVAVESLITETVAHNIPAPPVISESSIDEIAVVSTTSLLAPRAAEAIRDAFAESDSATLNTPATDLSNSVLAAPMAGTESKADTVEADEEDSVSGLNTKLPGVSDDAMARYKKEMFRRDI